MRIKALSNLDVRRAPVRVAAAHAVADGREAGYCRPR
jgi:hypothetical protein